MIKRVLVPLDPSPFTQTAIDLACALAGAHDAEITGLVVLDIPGIEKSIGPVPIGGMHFAEHLEKTKVKEANQRIRNLLASFAAKCDRAGLAHVEAQRQGEPSKRIIDESMFYDLVVMGLRTFFHFETQENPGNSLEEVLDHTVTPICGVPEKMSLPSLPEEKLRCLLAFDGSLPAARALQRFAQLAVPSLTEATVLISHDDKDAASYYLDGAEDYLRRRSFKAVEKRWTPKKIEEVMDEEYLNWAHLIFVGASSTKGLLEFMMGSLTRHLVETARKPVIIC